MTLEDYKTATELLEGIKELERVKVKVNSGVQIVAQAEIVSAFVDDEQITLDVITAIDAGILSKQNAFAAL